MSSFRDRLRGLPSFPEELAVLDPADVPAAPDELFRAWLWEAIASGARQANAATLATVRPDGTPDARTLILKDIDERGYHFSTSRRSRKAQQLEAAPRATLLFFWRESGRQVRLTGTVHALDDDTSQADWAERPHYAGSPNPDWQVYALDAEEFEFMQARFDRNHTRVVYTRDADGWHSAPATTPAG